MTAYTVRPLSDRTWLRRPSQRAGTRFQAKWVDTEALLLEEVDRLGGRQLVIEVDVREQDLKLDGTLRANAREAASPAVVVAFETSKHGPMLYRCDTFVAPYSWQGKDWHQNVRAIALTLQALRAVDRYGATETGQQYAGFKAIGGGTPMPGPTAKPITRDVAKRVIYDAAREIRIDADMVDLGSAYRWAIRATHPDAGGTREAFDRVQAAARVLGLAR